MPLPDLSRRERQIMDALFRLGRATAHEVRDAMPDPPSYSAVRTQLRILEDKGHVMHEGDGIRYFYQPTLTTETAAKKAVRHVLSTFFDDSPAQAVAALLDARPLSDEEYDRLTDLIANVREQGR